MDDFNTIRLKKKVIEKFKEYSKKISPSYSETLDYMIAFFEDTGLSPYDTMHNPILSCTRALSKRTKAVTDILRNIEKTQLIPTDHPSKRARTYGLTKQWELLITESSEDKL